MLVMVDHFRQPDNVVRPRTTSHLHRVCTRQQTAAAFGKPLNMSKTIKINSSEHFATILSSSKAVIVDCKLGATFNTSSESQIISNST